MTPPDADAVSERRWSVPIGFRRHRAILVSSRAAVGPNRHRFHEDVLALGTGTLLVSLGMAIYTKATLLFGSTAGAALLIQRVSGVEFGTAFFAINLPFCGLAVLRMGWGFAARTFLAICLVSLLTHLMGAWIGFSLMDPLYATVVGGALTGTGLLALFRHHTGLGGINILALYLQERWGIRAGVFQLLVDVAVLSAGAFVLPTEKLALSIFGATIVNTLLAVNHRPGRYIGLT